MGVKVLNFDIKAERLHSFYQEKWSRWVSKKKKNKDLHSQGKEKILQSYKNISASKNFLLKNREHIALATVVWHMAKITFYFWALRFLLIQFVF